jgi:excinuclease ABC subunit B
MRKTLEETDRRRAKQVAYNEEHGITPETVSKSRDEIIKQTSVLEIRGDKSKRAYVEPETPSAVADPVLQVMNRDQLSKSIEKTRKSMLKAAREMDFPEAARLRDEMFELQNMLKEKFGE